MTTVTVAYIFAGTIVAEILLQHALSYRGILARNHLHVANLAGPSRRAIAVILVLQLHARSLVLTRIIGAPVYIRIAMCTRVTIRTMTCVILHMIMTSGAIFAG